MGEARVIVVGGGAVGLGAAMMLARDGHDVTVLERNPAPPPSNAEEAWAAWERPGVNQFRLLHLFAARWARIMEAELPGAVDRLLELGGLRMDYLPGIPEELTGGRRPDDDRFVQVTGRRPVVEAAMAMEAATTPNLVVRRGASVASLLTGPSTNGAPPHVTGVRLDDGEELHADLVVDAGGRRSSLPRLLAELGCTAPDEEVEDSGFVYYGRYFRSSDGAMPPLLGGVLQAYDSVSVLTLVADNGTYGLGIIAAAGDAALRPLKDAEVWDRVWRSYPLVAHWADGKPIDDGVAVMAKIEDRHRRLVVDGRPCATGVVVIGDAWACTNPSLGRGAAIGMIHAQALRDHLRVADVADREGFALGFDEATMATVEPYYRSTLSFDRHRLAEVEAEIAGVPYETDDPAWEMTRALMSASGKDGDTLRAFLTLANVLATPEEIFADPNVLEKTISLGGDWRNEPAPGPTRRELLDIVGAA